MFPSPPDLELEVAALFRQVHAGSVTTFGGLGAALGEVQAARWLAGDWLGICKRHDLPGHRVVLKDGRLPDFRGLDPVNQARKLRREGVTVRNHRVDLAPAGILHGEFQSDRPLDKLRQVQIQLRKELRLEVPQRIPKLVAGVDVSYVSPWQGVAGYALVEVSSGRLVGSVTHHGAVQFPYVPGFLSFREIPLYLDLLEEVRRQGLEAQVLIVDGNGALHQRQMGVAAHLGVVADLPTIGVSKSLLCGKLESPVAVPAKVGKTRQKLRGKETQTPTVTAAANVTLDGVVVARALWTASSQKPIYVSPGQRVTLDWSVELVQHLFRGHKLPEPTHLAHTLSRRAARGGHL